MRTLIIEPSCEAQSHVSVSSGFIEREVSSDPTTMITFIGETEHLGYCMEALSTTVSENVEWHPFKSGASDTEDLTDDVVDILRSKTVTKILALSQSPRIRWAEVRRQAGYDLPIQIVLHGELEMLNTGANKSRDRPVRRSLRVKLLALKMEVNVFGIFNSWKHRTAIIRMSLSGRIRSSSRIRPPRARGLELDVLQQLEELRTQRISAVLLSEHIFENAKTLLPEGLACELATMPMPWSSRPRQDSNTWPKCDSSVTLGVYGHGGAFIDQLYDKLGSTSGGGMDFGGLRILHISMNVYGAVGVPGVECVHPNRMIPRPAMIRHGMSCDALVYPHLIDEYQLSCSLMPFEALWLGVPLLGLRTQPLEALSEIHPAFVKMFDALPSLLLYLRECLADPTELKQRKRECEQYFPELVRQLRGPEFNRPLTHPYDP